MVLMPSWRDADVLMKTTVAEAPDTCTRNMGRCRAAALRTCLALPASRCSWRSLQHSLLRETPQSGPVSMQRQGPCDESDTACSTPCPDRRSSSSQSACNDINGQSCSWRSLQDSLLRQTSQASVGKLCNGSCGVPDAASSISCSGRRRSCRGHEHTDRRRHWRCGGGLLEAVECAFWQLAGNTIHTTGMHSCPQATRLHLHLRVGSAPGWKGSFQALRSSSIMTSSVMAARKAYCAGVCRCRRVSILHLNSGAEI